MDLAAINGMYSDNTTALIAASEKGHTEIVQLLLTKGDDVNSVDKSGWTALINALKMGRDGKEVVQALLGKVTDVNNKGWVAILCDNDWTGVINPLKNAPRTIVQLLKQAGAK